jgi:hypothetical protein
MNGAVFTKIKIPLMPGANIIKTIFSPVRPIPGKETFVLMLWKHIHPSLMFACNRRILGHPNIIFASKIKA